MYESASRSIALVEPVHQELLAVHDLTITVIYMHLYSRRMVVADGRM